MKKRRWQMLYGYTIFQIKPLFARKAIHHNPTNCPYFLSILWPKRPIKNHKIEKINRLTRSKRTVCETKK